MRRLIVNADDFGLTAGVNRAILEAHERGIVTSSTLMANARAFDQAAGMARSLAAHHARFSVGCHVVLLDGEPLLPADRVASLLQPGAQNGNRQFRGKLNDFVIASFRNKLNPAEIEAETVAQIERLQSAGVRPSHFDTHKHAHMFPAVLRPLLRAARACGVPAVRNPFGRVWPLPIVDLLRKRKLWRRFAELNVLRNFAGSFRREVEAHGLRTTDGSLAVLVTGLSRLETVHRDRRQHSGGDLGVRLPPGVQRRRSRPGRHPIAGIASAGTRPADLAGSQRCSAAPGN